MTDNRNTILAVLLSGLVLIGWQYFYNIPAMEKQRAQQAQQQTQTPAGQPSTTPSPSQTPQAGTTPSQPQPAPGAQPAVPGVATSIIPRAAAIAPDSVV